MRRILLLLAFILVAIPAQATTTVTGKIQNLGTGNVISGAFVRFWLRGCGGNQPRINGTSLIGPSQGGVFFFDLVGDSSGNISGTLYSTRDATGLLGGDIECGGSTTAVWYGMQVWVNGKAGPEVAVHALSGSTLDVTQVTPITTNPVVISPTGDGTYLRLDAGNSPETGNVNFTGNNTHTGSEKFKYLNNIRLADSFAGADCGAKVNSADSDLGALPGEIWVSQLCGTTWTTAPSISTLHVVRFIQGGTYLTPQWTLANYTGIVGSPQSPVFVVGAGSVTIKQANGTNASPFINGNGSDILFRDIIVDGNAANNTTAGPNINCIGSRCIIQNVTSMNSHSHGLQLGDGTCCQNRGSGTKISHSYFVSNTGSGVFVNFTTDIWITQSELDNNSRYGLESLGLATGRIFLNDVGGNTLGGILASGTLSFQSNGWMISGNDFKNNLGIDLDVESDTGAPHAIGYAITGNTFQGLGGSATANTYPAIRSNGGGAHTITGNFIQTVTPSYKYCINIAEPAGNQELADEIVGNQCTGSFGTGTITTTASTHYGFNFFAGTANQADSILAGTVSHDTTNPALSGFLKMSSTDQQCWRNNANSADVCLSKTAGDALQYAGVNIPQFISSGTAALGTGAINSNTCAAAVTVSASGVASTDAISWSFNADPNTVTGYGAGATGTLSIWSYPTANNINFRVCNLTAGSITPGAATLNWRVVR